MQVACGVPVMMKVPPARSTPPCGSGGAAYVREVPVEGCLALAGVLQRSEGHVPCGAHGAASRKIQALVMHRLASGLRPARLCGEFVQLPVQNVEARCVCLPKAHHERLHSRDNNHCNRCSTPAYPRASSHAERVAVRSVHCRALPRPQQPVCCLHCIVGAAEEGGRRRHCVADAS